MQLKTGKEVPDELFAEVIESFVMEYAGLGFEDFDDVSSYIIQSIQEDAWLGEDLTEESLTYDEAVEVWEKVKDTATCFAEELAGKYQELKTKYIDEGSWMQ